MRSAKSFVHREYRPLDPAFLHDERQYLERQWGVLHVMERHRDDLVHDIEKCRSLARRAGIPARPPEADKLLALIGIGNRFRRDDGAGLEVARRLRLAHPTSLQVSSRRASPPR